MAASFVHIGAEKTDHLFLLTCRVCVGGRKAIRQLSRAMGRLGQVRSDSEIQTQVQVQPTVSMIG